MYFVDKKKPINMAQPLVSIITPMYNSSGFIEECIDSIQAQSYIHWELWLIDDASTDDTLKVINPFLEKNPRIKFLQNPKNSGTAVARNYGINHANGEFIAFLDADDLWLPQKLQVQVEVMLQTNCDICFSSYYQINEAGTKRIAKVIALPNLTYKKLLKSNYVGNLTGMYNAKKLGKINSANLRKRQDWLLWLNAIKVSNKPALGINAPLALYRIREDSMSSNKLKLIKHNYWVYKKGLGFSTMNALIKTGVFLVEHFFVKAKYIKKL